MNLEGPSNIIEMKFRQNADWTINWGNNEFPGGFAFQDGPNIPVLIDTNAFENTFYVTFDCSTGEYHFYSQSISLIGEFTNWSGDHFLSQDSENPNIWRTILKLTPAMNSYDPADIVEMKFRKGADWTVNWGATEFPGGIGMPFGPNIPVPVMMDAPFTVYEVTFNSQTGAYNFVQVSAKMVPVSNWALMIGGLLIVAVAVLRFRRII